MSSFGLATASNSRDVGPTLAGERGPPAPRSFLPEFADERNRELDREIRVRPAPGRSASWGAGARAHLPPAPRAWHMLAGGRPACLPHNILILPSQALEAELISTQALLQENEEHSQVLAEHLNSVQLEIRHTQARLTSRTREVESEAHLRELAARESGRLRSDIARAGKRRAEAAQHVTGLQTEVFQAGEKLAQFKLVQNWNQVGALHASKKWIWLHQC